MKIEDYFAPEYIVTNLAKYEMFYQVALGRLVHLTNSKEIKYDIEFQLALGSIYELIKELEHVPNLDEIFENELKKQSAMDAVQNFVNENLDSVKNGELNVEPLINDINDNTFFNQAMLEVCSDSLYTQVGKWEGIITPEISQAIMTSLQDLEAKA